jgi:hypothetical protein
MKIGDFNPIAVSSFLWEVLGRFLQEARPEVLVV